MSFALWDLCDTNRLTGGAFVWNKQSDSNTNAWIPSHINPHQCCEITQITLHILNKSQFTRKRESSGHTPCCFLRHMTVKRVAKADMMTRGTVMAMARIGPAHGEWTKTQNRRQHTIEKWNMTVCCIFTTTNQGYYSSLLTEIKYNVCHKYCIKTFEANTSQYSGNRTKTKLKIDWNKINT